MTTHEKEQDNLDKRSQIVQVPIDEKQAIGVKVSPTFGLDDVQSVTLKAFRKVIGYDTFNSILKKDRHETKDSADYYNVTVSMMIKRNPKVSAKSAPIPSGDIASTLDKGFPYDDGDIDPTEHAKAQPAQALTVKQVVGKLNGENITKQSLMNLLNDRTSPVTTNLVQLEKSDADNLSTLFDSNVTRGALKNLVTDKPAPITTALA